MCIRYTRIHRAFALLLAAAFPISGLTAANQPNILLIIADDLGVDLVSTYVDASIPAEYPPGYTAAVTPTIDGLADTGVTFANAWSSPSCSPTRATILTGQYGFRNGVHWPIGIFTPVGSISQLDVDNPYLLPKLLQQAGYATALTGKWHMTGGSPEALDDPGQAGFDNSWGPQAGAVGNFYNWTQLVNEVDPLTGDITVAQQSITTYATTEDVDRAVDWIEDQAMVGKPWFLWAAFIAPHLPVRQNGHFPPASLIPASRTDGGDDDCNGPPGNLPPDASDQLIRNCYEAGMEALDAEIARLLNEIDLLGHLDNTVVIFLGDNGTDQPVVLDPVDPSHSKGTVYLQGVHVPLIINGPDTAAFSRVTDNPVHTVDLYQTILDLADASNSVPPSVPIDSVSVEHMLHSNGNNSRKRNFSESCVPYTANGWALNPAFFDFPPHDGQTITDHTHKLINRTLLDDNAEPILDQNGEEQRLLEFYDIENDPYELVNLLEVGLTNKEQARFNFLTNKLEQLTDGKSCSDWRAEVFGN